MSNPHLPQEITEHIVDLLHDEPKTLRQCCLVSRSWVPRTRKHLFGAIKFQSSAHLAAWKKAFPNPLNSPAYYTNFLDIEYTKAIVAVSEDCSWLQSFSNVVWLSIWASPFDFEDLTPSQVFNIICSLPVLEDLHISTHQVLNDSTVFHPSASPPLTGTLKLWMGQRIEPVARRLLALPNGIHFQTLKCMSYFEDDFQWVNALVDACADTLQYICISPKIGGEFHSFPFTMGPSEASHQTGLIDFSRATKLREISFMLNSDLSNVSTAMALKTITPDHRDLQLISIHVQIDDPTSEGQGAEEIRRQWMALDRLLIQLWKLNAFHTQLIYSTNRRREGVRERVEMLLPEMRKRGIVGVRDSWSEG